MHIPVRYVAILFILSSSVRGAAQNQKQFLSGLGKDDPVQWQFMCDKGQNANKWSTIGVPSNWELQGFGIYEYGQLKPEGKWPQVHGVYKRTFTTPKSWQTKAVFLNFEGVMTDARVAINGQSAGPIHQGGYYAFKYDITKLLKPSGQINELQVDVDDESINDSVNGAERRGDYWNFSGMFRPVYLEAVPKIFIDHVAIGASAEGSLSVDVAPQDTRTKSQVSTKASISMRVLDLAGKPVGVPFTVDTVSFGAVSHLVGKITNPRLWTAETPNLYQLEVRLRLGETVVHTVRQKFGFRTIEVRPGQGLFVNGVRVFLKGVTRHSFWPDSGRTTSSQLSRSDIRIIKEMNGNAIRSSHYPPDRHFLDAADELGIYVLDELAGWHQSYDTEIGRKLVREMVEHDVNHPSILFWDNGNEGGFNFDLDGEFSKYDPEERIVLHPWSEFPLGIADTKHYPTYEQLLQKLSAAPVFFPTEMRHGLYDGGAGASLEDYWDAILKSKAGAGGFIWAFLDEDVRRVDKGGVLDSEGNYAPDGIVGPYREKEGSYNAIKSIWSPILVTKNEASQSFTLTNRYSFINANQCTLEWETIAFHQPNDAVSGSTVLASRTDRSPALKPGAAATFHGWSPPLPVTGGGAAGTPDAIRLRIKDGSGRVIQTYVWPIKTLAEQPEQHVRVAAGAEPVVTETDDRLIATTGDLAFTISKHSGLLISVSRQGKPFSLTNGPRVLAMGPRPLPPSKTKPEGTQTPSALASPALSPASTLKSITHRKDGDAVLVVAEFDGPLKSVTYRLDPSRWLHIDYSYELSGPKEYFGVGFDYPEALVRGLRYLGDGPTSIYQNRLLGGTLDVWNKSYNDTMVGDPDDLKPGAYFDYPVFKGYYGNVRWLQLVTSEGLITALIDQQSEAPTYVQIFTPKIPPVSQVRQAYAPFPEAGISFLQALPAIGSKFTASASSGPKGEPAIASGQYKSHISLFFGRLPLNVGQRRR